MKTSNPNVLILTRDDFLWGFSRLRPALADDVHQLKYLFSIHYELGDLFFGGLGFSHVIYITPFSEKLCQGWKLILKVFGQPEHGLL